jgi:proteasome lid subunit RPN8/RPN11
MLETHQLSSHELTELTNIYQLRYPTEACGVIIPSPYHGKTGFVLPNRSMTPQSSYLMTGKDLSLELNEWFEEHADELAGVVFWHTHPSGDAKPSKTDRQHRVSGAMNVIVSFPTPDADIKLHWY